MRKLAFIFAFLFFLLSPGFAFAANYTVSSFQSNIEIQKDTSILVQEKINLEFLVRQHGIFRNIPVVYNANAKTLKTDIDVISVANVQGETIPFVVSRNGRDAQIKIGDPNKYVMGKAMYIITYKLDNVVQRYEDHDELYWNVVGSGWDTEISEVIFHLKSEYANINDAACFAGEVGTFGKSCDIGHDTNAAVGTSNIPVGNNKDLTVVISLEKENDLAFPGAIAQTSNTLKDNWGYFFAFIPIIYIFYFWYKKGRDKTFGEKLYYGENDHIQVVPVFKRAHLPTVYQPINGLTPAQVGTLVDERVDIHDIVAEIVELARLGYIKITKLKKKSILSGEDYKLKKLEKDQKGLNDYQKYILEKLFKKGDEVKTSEFKKIKFYQYLEEIRKKIYKSVDDAGYFEGRPDSVRIRWALQLTLIFGLSFLAIIKFVSQTENPFPIFLALFLAIPSYFFVFNMPRKSAKGYALFRDILGLQNYLKIGKWRHEIYEKNLFIEEMIPLAISLGVIKKLSDQMKDLGIEPPKYYSGVNISSFDKSMSSSLLAGSSSSSSSGWSGGSGFSGGSVGGGFGGGGGGSW